MEFKELKIGIKLIDKQGVEDFILDLTSNSVLVSRKKRKEEGINCEQWFAFDKNFEKEFKIGPVA